MKIIFEQADCEAIEAAKKLCRYCRERECKTCIFDVGGECPLGGIPETYVLSRVEKLLSKKGDYDGI